MKKILSMLLTVLFIVTVFVGCTNTDKPTDATETTSTVMDDIPVEMADDVTPEEVTTDEEGNEVLVGKDADGNTVEIKKDKDGTVTKTVTDKETGKKTEQTTTVAPKPVTTTSKSQQTTKKSETTTKKTETTTKKPTQNTTTEPTTTTTTEPAHTHNFVKKSKQVLVKEAWDEDVYETREIKEMHKVCACGYDCTENYRNSNYPKDKGITCVGMLYMYHTEVDCPRVKSGQGTHRNEKCVVVGTEKIKVDTIHHDAQYKTEYWYECSCGAKK